MYTVEDHSTEVIQFLQKSLYMQSCDNLAFLTIHFHKPQKDAFQAKNSARRIYSRMLNQLQGKYWYHFPLPSITIIEHGKTNVLHVHSVFNLREHCLPKLDCALSKTCHIYPYLNLAYDIQYTDSDNFYNFSPVVNHLFVRQVFNKDVLNYITKEYNLKSNKIDFGNLWTSEMLFNLR